MSFKIRKLAYRPWPVTVTRQVGDESGNVVEEKNTFVGHFKPITEAQFEALVREAETLYPKRDDGQPDFANILRHNAHVFGGVLVGWGPEVTDGDGQPIPFTADVLRELVTGEDGLAVSNGLNEAINQLRFGYAPTKNSPTSPVPGPTQEAVEVEPEKSGS